MDFTKGAILPVIFLIVLAMSGCVSKSTFEEMADHAQKLDTDLGELQNRHNELQSQCTDLQSRHEALLQEKAILSNAKEALQASNKELEEILAAKEDALSKKIADLRQEMATHVMDCTSRLATQTKEIGERDKKIAAQGDELRERDLRLADQAGKLTATSTANTQLTEDLRLCRAAKEAEVQQMNSTYQSLIAKMKSEIDNGQITISELKGKLTVNMIDAILFDSGKAEVKPDGLLVLQKVIDILKDVSGKTIRIAGHTDNVPIVGLLAQKYPSNWELSAARAVNVARFLQERGLDPTSLNVIAYGEYKPVADNTSEAGRAKNRRIEIVLVDKE